jgi:hypothetical protein
VEKYSSRVSWKKVQESKCLGGGAREHFPWKDPRQRHRARRICLDSKLYISRVLFGFIENQLGPLNTVL